MSDSKRIRWKRNPPEIGLRRIVAGPQGSTLHDGVVRYATTDAIKNGEGGWYWVAGWGSGIPHKNTSDEPVKTEDEAKRDALAYVRQALQSGRASTTTPEGA